MKSWKQADTYEDTSQVSKATEEEPQVKVVEEEGADGKKKRSLRFGKGPLVIIGGVVLAVVLGFGMVLYIISNHAQMETPNVPADPDTVVNPGIEDPDYWSSWVIAFQYTSEEIQQLRAWGYTGTEIEQYQVDQVPAADLIEASRQAQEEARATLANPESPEYKNLLEQTWLGEPSITVPYVGTDTAYTVTTRRVNCDYVKTEPHGTNLMLKVLLPDGTHHFMEVSVIQWSRLAPSGNIIVDYSELSYNGQVFITNMVEVVV